MIRHGFDGGEELLRPSHIAQPVEGFPETVLVTFQRRVVEALQRRFPVETVNTVSAAVEGKRGVKIFYFVVKFSTVGRFYIWRVANNNIKFSA